MPGNEFGERIHNFFGQEGPPQGQHQSQVDGSWSAISNGLLVNNQRQIDSSLISRLKNYNAQQNVDSERGQSSSEQHGLIINQQPIRSEFSRSEFQNNQQPVNGYMHGNQLLQTMQNEGNYLGMDAESSGRRLPPKGVPSDLHKMPMRLNMGESPVNYDFFGGQHQVNGQFPGMPQSLPRQQMPFNDLQLLQQQVMIKQMNEYQMQQQLHKQELEARQLNSFNQVAVSGNRLSDSHSHPLINGVPLHDSSNNSWQPELMTENTHWLQRCISPAVQGSSSGLVFNPEQGHMNFTGSVPQQFEQSLYGMPVIGARGSQSASSPMQMNKLSLEHVSASSNSSLANQHTAFSNKDAIHESNMAPRPSYQDKLLFSGTSNNGLNFQNLQQDHSRESNISMQTKFADKQEATGPSDQSCMKHVENVNAAQKVATLDPTEEKFLFGLDNNLWDAFGSSTNMSLEGNSLASGSDLFGALPSLQSGSWSALMQSAVAETTSGDAGPQEQGFKVSNARNERMQTDATQYSVTHFQDKGDKVLDYSLPEKPIANHSQLAGNVFASSTAGLNGQNNTCFTRENESVGDGIGIWKAASNSNSSSAASMEHRNFFTHNQQIQRTNSGFTSSSPGNDASAIRDAQRSIPQHSNTNYREGNEVLMSSTNDNAGETASETNDMGNSGDRFRSNFSPQMSAKGFRESTQANVHDSSMLPCGKQTQSGSTGRRLSIPRKFQYHPMGDIDVSDEPYRKKSTQLPLTFQQVSGGNQGYMEQSKTIGQTSINRASEKGNVSQGGLNRTNEVKSAYASVDRNVDRCNQVKSASSRQTMLELLHKVDQSQEHDVETSVSRSTEEKACADAGGHFQLNQSSASQGFSLQLAPPSQPLQAADDVPLSQSSMVAGISLNSLHNISEKGGMSQSRLSPWASNQSFLHQDTYKAVIPGIPGKTNNTSGVPLGYHQSAANQSVNSVSEMSTSQVKERNEYGETVQRRQLAHVPSRLNPITHNRKGDSTEGFSMLGTMSTSQPLLPSCSSQLVPSSGMMSGSQANVSTVQHPLKLHAESLRSRLWSNDNLEGRLSRQEKTNQTPQNGGDGPLAGRNRINMVESQGKHMPDAAALFSKMTQSNLQTHGQSFVRHNTSEETNSLRPEHLLGNREDDSFDKAVKRAEDSIVDPQKVVLAREQQSHMRSDCLLKDGLLNSRETAHCMLPFGQSISQAPSDKNSVASSGADHPQISPQMAPSWFNQYRSFKNGVMQPQDDACKSFTSRITEQSSMVGTSVDALHSGQVPKQLDPVGPGSIVNMQPKAAAMPAAEALLPGSLPHGAATELPLTVDRPKKRKTATSELVSWSKEVMHTSQRAQTLSEAEVDWARATDRFAEKLEIETQLYEEVSPALRSKRRLIYTTQLIQQLFSPPMRMAPSIGNANHETLVYSVARSTLGDACSTSESLGHPIDDATSMIERTETAEEMSDKSTSKAAEDYMSRAQRLESEFARMETGTTIWDLRMEVQDLEKFSVINRFARFHARGPLDGTEPSMTSSSSDRNANSSLRLNPQRYVAVAPMIRNVPEGVQCLSL